VTDADDALATMEHGAPDLAMIGLLISGVRGLARCAQLRPPAASSRAVRLPLVLTGNPRNRPEAMLTDPRASPPPISCAC
jgi:CheY-like chemotaxis protein